VPAPDAPSPIPSVVGGASVNAATLDGLVGKELDDICGMYGSKGDTFNHCAHFVSHVLQLRIPGAVLCSNAEKSKWTYEQRREGFCIRVNEVFNSCKNRAMFLETEPGSFLMVATTAGNITSRNPLTIGSSPVKHIGFAVDGNVYHYSNSQDKVVKVTFAEFATHYGRKTVLMRADLP
jgi:hypothetical protein